jgi:hypothetical protein
VTSSASSDRPASPFEARRWAFSSIELDKPCRLCIRAGWRSILVSTGKVWLYKILEVHLEHGSTGIFGSVLNDPVPEWR